MDPMDAARLLLLFLALPVATGSAFVKSSGGGIVLSDVETLEGLRVERGRNVCRLFRTLWRRALGPST